jgi:uncharacterized protein YyaL (SSP411 family)
MNALSDAASPYLLAHAGDPVDWRPWGAEPFAEARRRDVPVLISIGYAACHWCHVMQRESFRDAGTAALLNERFVAIKIDREEHPDVDAVYMAALQAMRGQGGWPLTAVTDHDGRTFFAGTYFPPDDRPGMPSFRRVLEAIHDAWTQRRATLLQDAERLDAHLRGQMAALPTPPDWAPAAPAADLPDVGEAALAVLRAAFDARHGGFGGAPKFPPHATLRWLNLRAEPEAHALADATLRAIARGGIHDPLSGGVARYSVDERWAVPHFEKMLYDNAQLLPRWAEAWRRSGDATFLRAARTTFAWLQAELRLPDGGYATALDADSEAAEGRHEEGAFYAWTATEVDAVVREAVGEEEEVPFARAAFGVDAVGPFEGRNVLRIAADAAELAERFGVAEVQASERLERLRAALREARARRPRPARDDKALASLQGLAILGLARAGRLLQDAAMVDAARACADWVQRTFVTEDGRLLRRAFRGRVGLEARLEDHAYLGLGLLELHRADGDPRWLEAAAWHADRAVERFADPDGGFRSAPRGESGPLPLAPRSHTDAAVPADGVAAAELVWRTARLRARPDDEARARAAVIPLAEAAGRHPQALGSVLTLVDLMRAPPRELAVTGPDEAGGAALWAEVARRRLDVWIVQRAREPMDGPLVEGRTTVDGRAAAWLCEGYACRLPETDPERLARALDDAERASLS